MSGSDMHSVQDHGIAVAEHARDELYDTLGQLRDRLDYAQRVDDAVDRTSARISAAKRENPIGFAVGVAVTAVTVGVAAWGIARLVARAFKA